jgi:dihydrofolate reductase
MRELTADMFVSLDGFAAGADGGQSWTFDYFGPEFAAYAQQVLAEPQIMIMGRVTYEIMARSWPSSPGPLARPMNSLPKLVFSATMAEPLTWNNAQLAKRGPVAEIRALKAQTGDPLRSIGSITLVRHLMAAGLVDRLRLIVFPHLLGQAGREPVFTGYPETSLTLARTTVLDARLVVCEYRPSAPVPVDAPEGAG